jgi:hypothetical protein
MIPRLRQFFNNRRLSNNPALNNTNIQNPAPLPDLEPVIHFVWAGGSKLLPEKNENVILDWKHRNPGMKICLWIDQNSFPKESDLNRTRDLKSFYKSSFKEKGIDIEVKDIEEELKLENEIHFTNIRYELDKLLPNYGASSDIIRYLILYKYGGAVYLDSDVNPSKNNNSEKDFEKYIRGEMIRPDNILLVSDKSQGVSAIGNDILCVTKTKNKIIKNIIDKIFSVYYDDFEKPIFSGNYTRDFFKSDVDSEDSTSQEEMAFFYNEMNLAFEKDHINVVLKLTGPKHVRSIVAKDRDTPWIVKSNLNNVETFKGDFFDFDIQNDKNWLKREILISSNKGCSLEDILIKCEKSIVFEIDRWGVFLLDDYYSFGIELSEHLRYSKVEFSEKYLKLINRIYRDHFDSIDVIKLTYEFRETRNWYLGKGIKHISKHGDVEESWHRSLFDRGVGQAIINYLEIDENRKKLYNVGIPRSLHIGLYYKAAEYVNSLVNSDLDSVETCTKNQKLKDSLISGSYREEILRVRNHEIYNVRLSPPGLYETQSTPS